MASMVSTIALAAILLCAGSVSCQSYTGQSGDSGRIQLNKFTADDILSLLRGAQGPETEDSSNDLFSTKSRPIAPGAVETVTTSIAPDGTRTVSTTRTFTGGFNPSRTGTPGASGFSGRPFHFGSGLASPDAPAWDPWAFLRESGFGFPDKEKIPTKVPETPAIPESEKIVGIPYKPEDDQITDEDVVDMEPIGIEPQVELEACSSVETSIEAVERCVNAVRQNPAEYYSLLPCTIPEYSPRPPLKIDPALSLSASKHAIDMAVSKAVTHTGSDGSSMGDRIWKRAKFSGSPIAENVAGGQRSARQVVFGWMCSSGHRKNIMSCSYDTMGTGIQQNGWIYWAQNFGCTKYNKCSC